MYTSSAKIAPSKEADICTHDPKYSDDDKIRESCKTFDEKSKCLDSCKWNPYFGIKFEKGKC